MRAGSQVDDLRADRVDHGFELGAIVGRQRRAAAEQPLEPLLRHAERVEAEMDERERAAVLDDARLRLVERCTNGSVSATRR